MSRYDVNKSRDFLRSPLTPLFNGEQTELLFAALGAAKALSLYQWMTVFQLLFDH